jgi:tetratricopeptide (TPR) repeat protein
MKTFRLRRLTACCVASVFAALVLSLAAAQGAEEPAAPAPAPGKTVGPPAAPPKAAIRPAGRPLAVQPRPTPPEGMDVPQGELPPIPERPVEQLPPGYFAGLADVYLLYGQWAKAEEFYQEAYKKEPSAVQRAPYAYRLAQLFMRRKEYDKALPLLEEAIQQPAAGPNTFEVRRYRMALAALYERTGQLPKAEAFYQDWLKAATTSFERDAARRELLRLWQRTGKLANAIEVYEAALKQNPADPEALETLRQIYTTLQPNPEKALAIAEQLAAAKPDDRDASLALLLAYERANQIPKAIDLATKLLKDKKAADTQFLTNRLIYLYIQSGQKDKAAQLADQLLAQEPKTADTLAQVAGLYQMLGRNEDAVTQFEAAARLATQPDAQERYLLSAAQAARRAKQYDKAERWVRQLLKSQVAGVAAQAKRLLFEIYEEQNKLDKLQVGPEKP